MDSSTDLFSEYVSQAIDNVPEPYQSKMQNIVFTVEDFPSEQQRKQLSLRRCDALFGLYEGVPLPRRGGVEHAIIPDKITIFRQPMEQLFPDTEALKKQIFKTVWHEVAHYFGLNHTQIRALEEQSGGHSH